MLPALLRLAAPLALLGTMTVVVMSADRLPGPIAARVVEVIDGDTMVVRAHIWLDQLVETKIRLLGVDAPEKRSSCPEERERAAAAERFVRNMVNSREVQLRDIRYDKYGGRVLARIQTMDGTDLGETLIRHGLARTYEGGKRFSWCS
jgi:endonuclease YncB( thermonuclease family)